MTAPIIELHKGIHVVRDDLFPGGTKSRLFDRMFQEHQEIVYACSPLSCTQVSLAMSAAKHGKHASVFTAARSQMTAATRKAMEQGASVTPVYPGYLSVVQARAREYCDRTGAHQAPLGFDTVEVVQELASIARTTLYEPDVVWCAAGSGTLSRALQLAWPTAIHHAVKVGKDCDTGSAIAHDYPGKFDRPTKYRPPFSSEPHYDAKAWEFMRGHYANTPGAPGKIVLFWNVLGDILK